jgi:hypothetical protein
MCVNARSSKFTSMPGLPYMNVPTRFHPSAHRSGCAVTETLPRATDGSVQVYASSNMRVVPYVARGCSMAASRRGFSTERITVAGIGLSGKQLQGNFGKARASQFMIFSSTAADARRRRRRRYPQCAFDNSGEGDGVSAIGYSTVMVCHSSLGMRLNLRPQPGTSN